MNIKIPLIGAITLIIIAIGTSTLFFACKKDKNCPTGYEGSDCDIEARTKFLGSWKAFETCNNTPSGQYTITIDPSTSSVTSITIKSFAQSTDVPATVNGSSFTIPQGNYQGVDASGSGSISSDGKTITVNYTSSDAFNSFSCSGTWTKQ